MLREVGAVHARRRHAEGGVRGHPRRAGPDSSAAGRSSSTACPSTSPRLWDELDGIERPVDLDRRARPRGLGRAAGLSDDHDGLPPVRRCSAAGRSGQTAALLLARWGLPRRRARRAGPIATWSAARRSCQQRDVLDIWDAVGAGAEIAAEGVTWTTAPHLLPRPRTVRFTFADRGALAVPAVRQHLSGAHRADARRAHRRRAADRRPLGPPGRRRSSRTTTGVTVTCATARRGDGPGSLRRRLRRRPRGRRAARCSGSTFDGQSFDDQFLICDIRTDLPGWANERRFYFDPAWNPGRQVLIHPCPDSTFRIDWQVPPGFDLDAEERTGGLDRADPADHRRPADYEIVWKSVYRFHSRVVDRMRVGRVLLAGDVAHLVVALRRARPELGRAGRRERRLEDRLRAARLGSRRRCWTATTTSGTRRRWRTSRSPAATMRFLVPRDRGGAPPPARRARARRSTDPAARAAGRLGTARRAVLVPRLAAGHARPDAVSTPAAHPRASTRRRRPASSCRTSPSRVRPAGGHPVPAAGPGRSARRRHE